jgi:hypothetical protein
MFYFSIDTSISEILLNVKTLLPQHDVSIVWIIVLLSGIKITEHESESNIFLRNHFRR